MKLSRRDHDTALRALARVRGTPASDSDFAGLLRDVAAAYAAGDDTHPATRREFNLAVTALTDTGVQRAGTG